MRTFYAKLLLFGEYALMYGARALALPFVSCRGNLARGVVSPADTEGVESARSIADFASWFRHNRQNDKMSYPLNMEAFDNDVREGLVFRSDIPRQYGTGSSGALCAALFYAYGAMGDFEHSAGDSIESLTDDAAAALMRDLALMESYFHGRSSGIDPLVSFLNRPVLLGENKEVSLPYIDGGRLPAGVYLADTGVSCSTSPLVAAFSEKMNDPGFREKFHTVYVPANNGALCAFLQHDADSFFRNMETITYFQADNMAEMIPEPFIDVMRQQAREGIYIKLLGSGGGGFLLAFAPHGTFMPLTAGMRRVL